MNNTLSNWPSSELSNNWMAFMILPFSVCGLCLFMVFGALVMGFRNMIQFPKQQKKRKDLNRKATFGNLTNNDELNGRNLNSNMFVLDTEMISVQDEEPNTFEQLGNVGVNILKFSGGEKTKSDQPIQVEIKRNNGNNTSLSNMNASMRNLKKMNTLPITTPSFWSLYTPLMILIGILTLISIVCLCIVTSVAIYQVQHVAQNIKTFDLNHSSPELTNNRTMKETYGSTKTYIETLIQLTASQESKAVYGLYSSNSIMRLLLFKNQSLYEQFNSSSTINYYSSDVKEINKTQQGVILSSWKMWNAESGSNSDSLQTFTLLVQIESSSSAYEAIFHLIVEDENFSNSKHFLVFVWILIIELLVCLIASNQIYLSMISYDPTNKELFISEWISPFTFFGKQQDAIETVEKDVTIEFNNLSFHSFEGKRILNNISGRIESGKLTAVMGATGSSKSTFLTVLSKRAHYGVQEGEIKLNGRILTESLKKVIGFVPQDDIMVSSLQVWETLMFSSIYRSMTNVFFPLFRKVKETAQMLNIRHKLFSTIGDVNKKVLSGGEKKRLNAGIEMINECQVLLLDEPTSGLDSKQALLLCDILSEKKKEGMNIICVIHQPSADIYEMFDDLILFKNGEMVAHGDAKKIAEKCAKDILHIPSEFLNENDEDSKADYNNPGDCVIAAMDIMTSEQQKEISKIQPSLSKFKLEKGGYQNEMSNFIPVPNVPFYVQGLAFLLRGILQTFHEFSSFAIDILINTISGIFIGAIYVGSLSYTGQSAEAIVSKCPSILYSTCSQPEQDDISSFMGILTLSISLSSILSSLSIFGREKVVFRRESQSGLNSIVYFLIKDLLAFVPITLASLFFSVSSYYLVNPKGSFGDYFGLVFLITATMYPLGFIISIALRSEISQIASGLIVFVLYLFSGITPSIPEMSSFFFPYSFLPHFSVLKYANELLYLGELKNYSSYSKSVETKGYIMEMMEINLAFMISFTVLFHILAAIVLWQSVPGSYVSIWSNLTKSKITSTIQLIRRKITSKCSTFAVFNK